MARTHFELATVIKRYGAAFVAQCNPNVFQLNMCSTAYSFVAPPLWVDTKTSVITPPAGTNITAIIAVVIAIAPNVN